MPASPPAERRRSCAGGRTAGGRRRRRPGRDEAAFDRIAVLGDHDDRCRPSSRGAPRGRRACRPPARSVECVGERRVLAIQVDPARERRAEVVARRAGDRRRRRTAGDAVRWFSVGPGHAVDVRHRRRRSRGRRPRRAVRSAAQSGIRRDASRSLSGGADASDSRSGRRRSSSALMSRNKNPTIVAVERGRTRP